MKTKLKSRPQIFFFKYLKITNKLQKLKRKKPKNFPTNWINFRFNIKLHAIGANQSKILKI